MSKTHWLALAAVPGVGGVTFRRLVERFGSVEAAFDAPEDELLQVPRFTQDMIERMRAISLDALDEEWLSLSQEGLDVLTWEEEAYPANLRDLRDAPPLLFVRGSLAQEDALAVAIVGTRQPAPASVEIAEMLASELAGRGLTIVSGLALGIDSAAHRGALTAAGGRTLAVLGSGLRCIHPRENAELAEEIAGRGALLSECHPNTPPKGQLLMARDRIVAGLSRAVIVVEAGAKSGSLDTAARAQRQGRLVFAVPGSPGTEALLAGGAERLDRPHRSQRPVRSDDIDWDALSRRIEAAPAAPALPEKQLSLWD